MVLRCVIDDWQRDYYDRARNNIFKQYFITVCTSSYTVPIKVSFGVHTPWSHFKTSSVLPLVWTHHGTFCRTLSSSDELASRHNSRFLTLLHHTYIYSASNQRCLSARQSLKTLTCLRCAPPSTHFRAGEQLRLFLATGPWSSFVPFHTFPLGSLQHMRKSSVVLTPAHILFR